MEASVTRRRWGAVGLWSTASLQPKQEQRFLMNHFERIKESLRQMRIYESCEHEWRAVITWGGQVGKECAKCGVTSYEVQKAINQTG